MKIGMTGLGRMGANMTERLLNGGHEVTGFDFNEESRRRVVEHGAGEAASKSSYRDSTCPGSSG